MTVVSRVSGPRRFEINSECGVECGACPVYLMVMLCQTEGTLPRNLVVLLCAIFELMLHQ